MGVRCLRDCIMKKDKSIKIRVSQDEHTAIHAIAKSNGLTLSEFIRNLANPISCDLIKKG
jgi:predicted DNA binding CopG/RHH family protein